MRTKTMLLSALIGSIGAVSAMAQTNVYSLNAVGYINITIQPGFNLISAPLIATPDNTVGTLLNNSNGALTGSQVFFYFPSTGQLVSDIAENVGNGSRGTTTNANGWAFGGTNLLTPGVGAWFQSSFSTNLTLTIVGTVPTGPITNTLGLGFSLVGSVVPMSGDIASNTISALTNYNLGDEVFVYNPASGYTSYQSSSNPRQAGFGYNKQWTATGDPIIPNVGEGFWYQNNGSIPVLWVENYSVSQ